MIVLDNLPQENNLAALTLHFFGKEMDKGEQLAVWSERPLRAMQLEYAAKDSFFTFCIQLKLNKLVKRFVLYTFCCSKNFTFLAMHRKNLMNCLCPFVGLRRSIIILLQSKKRTANQLNLFYR